MSPYLISVHNFYTRKLDVFVKKKNTISPRISYTFTTNMYFASEFWTIYDLLNIVIQLNSCVMDDYVGSAMRYNDLIIITDAQIFHRTLIFF